ncbi:hypothetical protein Q1W71_22060 [Flavobacterium pectinovorum]|uniref:hypothetical protein n=1 Tax=Flavobacterium pectinovorum TaxID=29533 RepID=UPI00266002C6|nr:hypothetical protein [Flavobacterium pectinovorum]WKL47627.1 hypothetical protein Q1W71_22060 [Flavobacterium pectinovorum]
MKPITIETYFEILEKCALEALESLKLKEFYPKDGTKAIWDDSSLTTQINGLSNDIANDMIRSTYIRENMRVTFLKAIDRNDKKFAKKYSVTRATFYKKCFESLLYKKSIQPESLSKPDLGIDINNPCVLTFIWNMRNDIAARSKVYEQHTANCLEYSKIINESLSVPELSNVTKVSEKSEIQICKQSKLSIKQIALKLAYEGVKVSKENANEIIRKFGHNSGQKLIIEFNKVYNSRNRITDPDETKRILQNKINLFESVAEILSPQFRSKAEDEIKILKSYLSNY